MKHEEIKELFSLFIDNRATDAQKTLVMTHVKGCAECKNELEELFALTNELKNLHTVPLPPCYHEELMERINAAPVFSSISVKRCGIAAAAVVFTLLLFGAVNLLLTRPAAIGGLSGDGPTVAYSARDDALNAIYQEIINKEDGASFIEEASQAAEDYRAMPAAAPTPLLQTKAELSADASADDEKDIAVTETLNTGFREIAENAQPAPALRSVTSFATERIVKNITMEIYVEDLFEAVNIINSLGGYNTTSIVNYYSPDVTKEYGHANIIRRVNVNELDYARGIIRDIGRLDAEYESQYDLTSERADLDIRRKNAENEISRLSLLIGKSDNLSNIIYIENRISDIDRQLDSYIGRLREIDSLAGMPYITVNITADMPYVPIIIEDPTFLQRIQKAFNASLSFTRNFIEGFMILIARAITPLAALGVIAIIVILIIRRFKGVKK